MINARLSSELLIGTDSMNSTSNAQMITAPALNDLAGINHAFFTREGGVSSGLYTSLNAGLGSNDQREDVVENRRRMAVALGVEPAKIASPYQVHSSVVELTDEAWSEDRPEADGVVTATPGLALGIVTADCGPVLFADPEARVIGAAHAGWKGALGGVLENTLEKMVEQGANLANITAILGPTISQKNYEVGPEFPAPFMNQDASNLRYFVDSKTQNHHMFDLQSYIVDRLANAGVRAASTNTCTYEGDSFFSYRRTTHRGEPDYGRQLSAIVLNEE